MKYETATHGFKLVAPKRESIAGTIYATSRHIDGRMLYEDFSQGGITRARIEDPDGNIVNTWRNRKGRMVECNILDYQWGWLPDNLRWDQDPPMRQTHLDFRGRPLEQ